MQYRYFLAFWPLKILVFRQNSLHFAIFLYLLMLENHHIGRKSYSFCFIFQFVNLTIPGTRFQYHIEKCFYFLQFSNVFPRVNCEEKLHWREDTVWKRFDVTVKTIQKIIICEFYNTQIYKLFVTIQFLDSKLLKTAISLNLRSLQKSHWRVILERFVKIKIPRKTVILTV